MKDLLASALAYTPPPTPIIYTQHSRPRDLFKNMSDHVTHLLETLQGLPSNWESRPKSTGWLLRRHVIPLPVSSPISSLTTVSSRLNSSPTASLSFLRQARHAPTEGPGSTEPSVWKTFSQISTWANPSSLWSNLTFSMRRNLTFYLVPRLTMPSI